MSIEVHNVTAGYGSTPVLHDISLKVAGNEWIGILGPNGAGKSTLMKVIAGLHAPASGTVVVEGATPDEHGRRRMAQLVAYLPQDPVFPEAMSAGEYVLLGRAPHLGYFAVEGPGDVAVATEVLELLDAGHLANRPLGDISGGERQRVVLARALAQEPEVLLLDEPTTALDIGHQVAALDMIGAIRQDRPLTIVAAMHDLSLAGQFSDRLILLAGGHMVADGLAREVLTTDLIKEHYNARVDIVEVPTGIAVVPLRP
ncbi:MAG: ABC transporter ATP-binding protein [bacterium]|nr:ABC transporter ATP-binding protein [bacterium]